MERPPIFQETQQFRQPWIWAILLGMGLFAVYALISQVAWDTPVGNKPAGNTELAVILIFILLLSGLMWSLRLETYIGEEGIHVRLFPFQIQFRSYAWDNIAKCYVRIYDPIREYGGWGLRGLGKNRALNVSGNNGIQLVMHDGARLLIGTQMPDEAGAALRKLGHYRE